MATITTDEAEELIDEDVPFIDVRTEEEFADGHVPGALNIPINVSAPAGMQPNPDFLRVVEGNLEKGTKFIVACKAGARSARAAAILREAGYEAVLDMSAGFSGNRNAFGEVTPGWQAEGREIEMEAEEEQTYGALKTKAGP